MATDTIVLMPVVSSLVVPFGIYLHQECLASEYFSVCLRILKLWKKKKNMRLQGGQKVVIFKCFGRLPMAGKDHNKH